MFSPSKKPRLFGLAPGVDFPSAFVQGLLERCENKPPEFLPTIEILVNTRRMQRRIREIFDRGPARLLPKISLITDLGQLVLARNIPEPVSKLQRRLELSQLVAGLIELQPDLAPKDAIFDLADSLANLMDEMQSEGVSPDVIQQLDVSDQSGHWQRSLKFIQLIQNYFSINTDLAPDTEARQRLIVNWLAENWVVNPPSHPIIIAGSTGSRGATHMLMQAVSKLPNGALVLPGYDFALPYPVWENLDDALISADHPQFRFRKLQQTLDVLPEEIEAWTNAQPPSPKRNDLISLALRPAPITNQWITDGKKLHDLMGATENISLVEASSSRIEAAAIALKLRECAEHGVTAALISPDRILTRQVTAALDLWGLEPDDSAGLPLTMSAPGRFLLQTASLFGQVLTVETLLALLKHPLCHSGQNGRGNHLRWTRDLELYIRKNGPPFPTKASLIGWAQAHSDNGCRVWAAWLGDLLDGLEDIGTRNLQDHLDQHIRLCCNLASGPAEESSGGLWEKPAGIKAFEQVEELRKNAEFGGQLSTYDYTNLFHKLLNESEVHDPTRPHPNIMIWGTLEARVQGADLVILAGLNDGVWPGVPKPDPWMNRAMRQKAGLLLPERQIGLSAHDFQQAVGAKEVWLTRSIRNSESQTVPSRWLNRLTNLLDGLAYKGGKDALEAMRARGNALLSMVGALEQVTTEIEPEPRPCPVPPSAAQPKTLSVTGISKLIRDPYAIYASKVLKLYPLDPLRQEPDAPLAGTVIHRILERFVDERINEGRDASRVRFMKITDEVLLEEAPWPTARCIWRAKLERVVDWFLKGEEDRAKLATPFALEEKGAAKVGKLDLILVAKADRLDRSKDGLTYIYDYKTGKPPSENQQIHFDKQLLLTAAIVERAGFSGLADTRVQGAAYIGLGSNPDVIAAPLEQNTPEQVWTELETLLSAYLAGKKGYTSRRAMEKLQYSFDYDHLARFGEWDETQEAKRMVLNDAS